MHTPGFGRAATSVLTCVQASRLLALDGIPRTAHLEVDLGPHIPKYTAFIAKQSSFLCKFDEAMICLLYPVGTFFP